MTFYFYAKKLKFKESESDIYGKRKNYRINRENKRNK